MTCFSAGPLIDALLDGELDAERQAQVLDHMEGCAECRGEYERMKELRDEVRGGATYFRAPEALRARILQMPEPRGASGSRYLAMAAGVLLAVSLGGNVFLLRNRVTESQLVAREVFSGHVRALRGNRLFDVPSSDTHTVKPWFAGKLDFSPDVRDLKGAGYPLTGGRVDYVRGRAVAALVFERGKHVIDLFTWPEEQSERAETVVAGYNVVAWTQRGMAYWAVSDANPAELKTFADLYRRGPDPGQSR